MSQYFPDSIGIFDSGIGGLTVVKAVTKCLPKESIIYFGDTRHAPWGDKSASTIQAYSVKICDMLLQQNCKMILIACNSASAVAYELVKKHVGCKAIVVGVVDPMVDYLAKNFANKTIGLIGTKQTIYSNIYGEKLKQRHVNIELHSVATPLLVPLIEEGANENVMQNVIKFYLSEPKLKNLDALVLGCTHYPLIKPLIKRFYAANISIIDSADIVANLVKNLLKNNDILSSSDQPYKKFYVSDYTAAFSTQARFFFKGRISLEKYPLWD